MKPNDIRSFREAMLQLQRNLNLQWKSDAACCGITVAQCHALLEIGKNNGITLVKLASILGLDNSTLSRTIDGMVKAKLITRRANPEDRRCLRLALTSRGKTVYGNINCIFDRFYSEIFAGIPLEKQSQIFESINILAVAFSMPDNCTCCLEDLKY